MMSRFRAPSLYHFQHWFSGIERLATGHTLSRLLSLALLTAGATYIVYITGGAGFAYTYLLLVPVLLAARWFGLLGGLLSGVISGLLLGPLMPLDATFELQQPLNNWLVRLLMYALIGGFAGWLHVRWERTSKSLLSAMGTDPRTGLPNQGALDSDLERLFRQRKIKNQPLALLMIRLTDLNDVIEALGTNAADELIAAMARRLKTDLPHSPGLYRFNMSELVVLLNYGDAKTLAAEVEVIANLGEEMWELKDIPVRVQMAVGSSLSVHTPDDHQEVIRRSRTALFAAMERKEFHCTYDPAHERNTKDSMMLVSRLRKSLREQELELHYQPKICLHTGQPRGCEGLIRWRDGKGGFIPPGSFMPKVENTTLIAPVTRFVIQQACTFLQTHPGQAVSVNFTARNLFDKNLLSDLPLILEQAGVAPQQLEIEITERALIKKPEVARVIISELRSLGLKVSMDDFGTGYSSFAYLKHLPISGLKIDRAFVKDLGEDSRADRLMFCLLEVARALELDVTAEGVETIEQAEILKDMGCAEAQGFFYARPTPANNYKGWLASLTPEALAPAKGIR